MVSSSRRSCAARVDLSRAVRRPVAILLCAALSGLAASARGTVQSATQGSAKRPAARQAAVAVNRTVPSVAAPTGRLDFSLTPTAEEIQRARVFTEPLVPVGGVPAADETRALAAALTMYRAAGRAGDTEPVRTFLTAYPRTPWRASLLANVAVLVQARGAFTRAVAMWDEAWALAKDDATPSGRAVAAFAMGQALAALTARGAVGPLEQHLASLDGHDLGGAAGGRVADARLILAELRAHPEHALPSGAVAVEAVWRAGAPSGGVPPVEASRIRGTAAGLSLDAVARLATRAGLALEMRVRPAGAALPVPAIVHLRVEHFSAVVARRGDTYLVHDPALGGAVWMSREALDEEASGYVLVPRGTAPDWAAVSEADAAAVIGHSCAPGGTENDGPPVCPRGAGGGGAGSGGGCGSGRSCGLVTHTLAAHNASLQLTDTPLSYTPPRGPGVPFTVRYDYREAIQPQLFSYANLGPHWTFEWVSFAKEEPLAYNQGYVNEWLPEHVWVYLRGGGREIFPGPPDGAGAYPAHYRTRAQLVRVSASPVRYERRLPDGSVEVFALSDTAPPGERRIFLTEVRDPHGQAVTLTYDAQYRLVALTDALGQVSTLEYAWPGDALKVTAVSDPFGRRATFTYTTAGQLASITDVIGLTSSMTYTSGDFVAAVTTPYGTTTFRHEGTDPANHPWVEATDPAGGTEHVEYRISTTAVPASVPAGDVPAGFAAWNTGLDRYVTLAWDAAAWAAGPGDVAKATVTNWFLKNWATYAALRTTPQPLSVKRPLEGRIWYAYPGQDRQHAESELGWFAEASVVARVLDDGTTQATETDYNVQGQVIARRDPLGRETTYAYAANGVDLLAVRQTKPGGSDLLAQYSDYTAGHLPQAITDAAGQTTTLTYNAAGQVLTSTNAKQETTTFVYDTEVKLQSVTGPMAGATTGYTYDSYGRVHTVTGSDGYAVTTDDDAFNRPTRVTYPDGTYEETTYDRLDVATRRDRLGRVTRYYYDALRRVTGTRDPAARTIQQVWGPGGLSKLVDAKGQATTWERDVQGRVVREVRADGVTATSYAYQPASGRLATVTDPKAQVTTYAYAADDSVTGMTFSNASIATPGVTYTYDSVYNRVATMVDGTGTTTYTYHPAGGLGAGQVASVDGPLTDDTITYTYDELGRVVSRTINGAANTTTQVYDGLGRVTSETNVLGTFTYAYVGATGRLQLVTYPNGQTSSYAYYDNVGDQRLQTIHHRKSDASTLSRFDYTYDAAGNILTWQQQADSDAPALWTYGYDRADQLTSAVHQTTSGTPSVLKRYAYSYDPAGNRASEQIDDVVTVDTHDSLNRLLTKLPGGPLVFKGTLSEPGRVTINGVPATVDAANQFQAAVPATAGTTTVTINAVDASGNAAEAVYEVDQAGTGKTFTYDANGNLTADGTRTFEWNARNQLVSITLGGERREFSYDGRYRRVNERTLVSGVLTKDVRFVMCGPDTCEERQAGNVRRQVYEYGERLDGIDFFYAKDHLGSLTELVDSASVVRARNRYDPFGRQERVGDVEPRTGFSGHVYAATAGLNLTYFRAYDAEMGRWISSDPLGSKAGPNFYAYVEGRPTTLIDPFGLQSVQCRLCNPTEADQARSAVRGVCGNVGGNRRCQQVLSQYNLLDCFKKKCSSSINVLCVPKEGSCGGCGGPCNPVSDVTRNIFIQPDGFRGICGSLTDTVAHEMAHMCGIGSDVGDEPARRDNRRKATDVGLACSGNK